MQQTRFTKSVIARRPIRPVAITAVIACALVASLAANLMQCVGWVQTARSRDVWQRASFGYWRTIDDLDVRNASLERRLDEMAERAESWRFNALFEQCMAEELYVGLVWGFRIEYDRHAHEDAGVKDRCLSKAARYPSYMSETDSPYVR